MARETVVSNFKLKAREILSSYAAFTLEGVMTARVKRGKDAWTIEERNGIAKGTSDGEAEAIYIPNDKAIKSVAKNIVPLLPKKVVIRKPQDILDACAAFDLKLVEKAGPNKKVWGGNACLASSTVFFQTLLKASGYEAWQMLAPKGGLKTFYMPNIAFNMVCGGEHVPGTKQDIQEMFFFAMNEKSVKGVFETGTKFFKQFEKNLVRDGLPTGTAKERGFVFPVKDNFEGLTRIKECAVAVGAGAERLGNRHRQCLLGNPEDRPASRGGQVRPSVLGSGNQDVRRTHRVRLLGGQQRGQFRDDGGPRK